MIEGVVGSEVESGFSADVTARSQTSFAYAFLFLPPARRRALNDVYAYCRLIDDIVDGSGSEAEKSAALLSWRHELDLAFHGGRPTHPVARGLQAGQKRFGLRYEDALAVLIGCETDLHKTRYATWDEVSDYCYHVASSVGLLCIELFGCQDPRSRTYAIHLGQALQLTNILRDIAEDAARDRIYLPKECLQEFQLSEADILSVPTSPAKRGAAAQMLAAVARRAQKEYRLAQQSRSERDRQALLPAEIMGQVYYRLLLKIEKSGLDVLDPQRRIALSKGQKLTAVLSAIVGSLLPARS